MKTHSLALLALVSSANAFSSPTPKTLGASSTQLNAESRREALGAIGVALGGLLVPEVSNALDNPALETFKGRKHTKGAFIPGKGMRNKEDNLLSLQNPALETFKGGKKTKGAFIPGKGLRMKDADENFLALANPALETFKGRKGTKGAFIPGKGLRNSDSFDALMG